MPKYPGVPARWMNGGGTQHGRYSEDDETAAGRLRKAGFGGQCGDDSSGPLRRADGFTIRVSDGKGGTAEVVSVTVSPVNDAPVAVDDSGATAEDWR